MLAEKKTFVYISLYGRIRGTYISLCCSYLIFLFNEATDLKTLPCYLVFLITIEMGIYFRSTVARPAKNTKRNNYSSVYLQVLSPKVLLF